MSSKTHGQQYFRPSENNAGGRTVITQQLNSHQRALHNTKSVVGGHSQTTGLVVPEPRTNLSSAPKQVLLNPYTHDTLYQIQKQKDRAEEQGPVLASGMTPGQWKNINQFQIVGQSHRKKHNYHIAIEHYFNLRSLYRKINEIKFKRYQVADLSTSTSLHKKPASVAAQKPRKTRPITSKKTQKYHEDQQNYYEPVQMTAQKYHGAVMEAERPTKKKKAKRALTAHKQARELEVQEQPLRSMNIDQNMVVAKKKKSTKKKIKPQKKKITKSNQVGNEIEEAKQKVEEKPKSKLKERHLTVDDFKNTNEQELIADNLGLARKGRRDVDLDDFEIEQRVSVPRSAKKPATIVHEVDSPSSDPFVKYGDFLHKAKPHSSSHEPPMSENVHKKQTASLPQQVKSISENNFYYNDKVIPEADDEVHHSNDSEDFELTNFQEKIKRAEVPEEDQEQAEADDEEDDIMQKIPYLESSDEAHLLEFKQSLIEMIFTYEIFNEEEFNNFFEAVCLKNQDYTQELLEEIFVEVKEYLYEQFQALADEEELEGEEGIDGREDSRITK